MTLTLMPLLHVLLLLAPPNAAAESSTAAQPLKTKYKYWQNKLFL
jgi:hypothetical protein